MQRFLKSANVLSGILFKTIIFITSVYLQGAISLTSNKNRRLSFDHRI